MDHGRRLDRGEPDHVGYLHLSWRACVSERAARGERRAASGESTYHACSHLTPGIPTPAPGQRGCRRCGQSESAELPNSLYHFRVVWESVESP